MRSERPGWLVAVGSSAGGIEALMGLLRHLPAGSPVAFVVAQHLSPTHASPLVELLARETTLGVEVAVDGASLVAGTVFVAPPDCDVGVTDAVVTVTRPGSDMGPKPSIDRLFRSAAKWWGDHAVGVVLSGTGSDGADGLRSIKGAGGLTIVQRLDTARFEAMPRAAAAEGGVDLVLAPPDIGPAVARICSGEGARPEDRVEDSSEAGLLRGIVLDVRAATGIDFSQYKETTLRRQIERRQAITQVNGLDEYRELVQSEPDEARALAQRMLVTVTSFFRDPDCWEALRPHIDDLVARLETNQQLRVWVPGCATGEEVYTVAMLVADAMDRPADLARRLKIFGTDLDEAALAVARSGRYTEDGIASIPEESRARWLRQDGPGWEVEPVLRDCVVFARHDIAVDPPFPRVNLISLRNVLIYFNPALQERVLQWCHFALAEGGLLLTGESERPSAAEGLFVALDARHRIYQRHDLPVVTPVQVTTAASTVPPSAAGRVRADPGTRPMDRRQALRDALIRLFAPPGLVIDDRDEVVEVIGDVAAWCWVAEGAHSSHVTALLREEFQPAVRALLVQVRHGDEPVSTRRVTTPDGIVTVTARRLDARDRGSVVVNFAPTTRPEGPSSELRASATEGGVPAVEAVPTSAELATQQALQDAVEELAASNEELQALNEELQASSEEMQASSEELSASNEELEATNEELSTLNQELQVRTNELVSSNADMENILRSMTSGTVIVDLDLRVRRFNQLAVRLFALIDTDIGRPLTAIPTTAPVAGLQTHLRAVIDGGRSQLLEVRGETGDFLLQLQPYVAVDGTVRGAMLVATDVTALAQMQRVVRRTLSDLEHVTDALRETVWQRAADGTLRILNRRVETLYGLDRAAVLANPSLLSAAVHPDDRDRVQSATAAAKGRWEIEYRIIRPDGEVRWVEESAIVVPGEEDEPSYTVGSELDVTDRHHAEQQAVDERQIFQTVFDNDVFGIVALDAVGRILKANNTFAAITAYDAASLVGMALTAIATLDGPEPPTSTASSPALLGPGVHDCRLVTRDNQSHWVTLDVRPLDPPQEQGAAFIVVIHDVTQLRRTGHELALQARYDSQTGLANRAHFRDQLDHELARADRTAQHTGLLWIDLDGFKEINDSHGHYAGDIVLREIASRLQSLGRRHDLVGRLGGDEFAMLITDLEQTDGLEVLVERVLGALRQGVDVGRENLFVSGSVGIAIAPADGRTSDELLRNADTAMYSAKQAGRDRHVYFETEMNEKAIRHAEQRHRLAAALQARDFVMHYQPIVDPVTYHTFGAEALVRWHRDGEMVAAAEFIELAEHTGQIRVLGQIVLDLVRDDLDALATIHGLPDLPIAVNLSPTQLKERSFLELLLGWNVPGGFKRLIAEVTETILLERDGTTMDALNLLQRLGATLSIDDFGTGYSNLELLERLEPTVIKLDQALLRRAEHDERGHALLHASVELAHALEAAVVVEGVETPEQRRLTTDLGVELIQGNHIAPPMPLADLVTWVTAHPPG